MPEDSIRVARAILAEQHRRSTTTYDPKRVSASRPPRRSASSSATAVFSSATRWSMPMDAGPSDVLVLVCPVTRTMYSIMPDGYDSHWGRQWDQHAEGSTRTEERGEDRASDRGGPRRGPRPPGEMLQ